MIEIGQSAPEFALPRDGGDVVRLSDLKGQAVVLYFYPKADTSGCTKEAIAFTRLLPEFAAAGVKVFGVSRDPQVKQEKFRDKHDLGTPLLSDEAGDMCEAYRVWVEKSMYGKKFMGIERSTFLIDGDGVLRQIWRKVKVDGHAEEVLEAARGL